MTHKSVQLLEQEAYNRGCADGFAKGMLKQHEILDKMAGMLTNIVLRTEKVINEYDRLKEGK